PDTQPFWDGARRGELLVQRCVTCAHVQFYPRALCMRCGGAVEWIAASGRGSVYSYTVVHRAPHEALEPLVPYVVALIDLEENVRMMSRLRGVAPEAVRIGQSVRVAFERLSDEVTLPIFEGA
ncbi:MAG: Zn-ribbon domain-containing OB-fold protein, partial [Candidatus Limnocylindria bacterium]